MRRILMLHKPRGLVVTRADELQRTTVFGALPQWARAEGWQAAGRLDRDSSGLLLFAREGGVLDALTRPGRLDKEYRVVVRGHVQDIHVALAKAGVHTHVGTLRVHAMEVAKAAHGKTAVRVVLREGRNRHIRRLFGGMCDQRHGTPLKVLQLKRVRIGPLTLDVEAGQWRWLTDAEVSGLLGGG